MIIFRKKHYEMIKVLIEQHDRQTKVIEEMCETFQKMDHIARSLYERVSAIERILVEHDLGERPTAESRH